MKFIFLLPLRVVFAERNIEPEVFQVNNLNLAEFKNKNVYFSQDKSQIVCANSEVNSYFLKVGEHWSFLGQKENRDSIIEKLNRISQNDLESFFKKMSKIIENPKIYEEEAAINLAKIKKEREIADLEYQKRVEEQKRKQKEYFLSTRAKYLNGEYIDFKYFEEWCKIFKIEIPIKTLGWARSNIASISRHSYQNYGKNYSSKSFNKIWHEFNKKIIEI